MTRLYGRMSELLIIGNTEEIKNVVQEALNAGLQAHEILEKGLVPGMDIVGQRFKTCEMFIPEVLLSAKAMHEAMSILRPLLSESNQPIPGTMVIGTVEGDLHDIGKNVATMIFQGAGFKVVDLGIDIKPQAFVEAVKAYKPNIVGMSALLTTTMPKMKETIMALQEAGVRDQIKVIIGGAPLTLNYANEIGADGYGADAISGVEVAKNLIGIS
ncbi:MAG: corrinoid protein [Candidatus Hodarchaeota archaeon]